MIDKQSKKSGAAKIFSDAILHTPIKKTAGEASYLFLQKHAECKNSQPIKVQLDLD